MTSRALFDVATRPNAVATAAEDLVTVLEEADMLSAGDRVQVAIVRHLASSMATCPAHALPKITAQLQEALALLPDMSSNEDGETPMEEIRRLLLELREHSEGWEPVCSES